MWKNNIKSTRRCIFLGEYGLDAPKQCLTKIVNKYNFNFSKSLLDLYYKKELYIGKGLCRAYYWTINEM